MMARSAAAGAEFSRSVRSGFDAGREAKTAGATAAATRRRSSLRDLEAEHHSALVMFGDVAVRHPEARVAEVEEDVHGLPGPHQHRVLPHQAGLDHSVTA